MEATGCLLSEAFGEVEEIKIKKKEGSLYLIN